MAAVAASEVKSLSIKFPPRTTLVNCRSQPTFLPGHWQLRFRRGA
jgi:hypothetical protein